MHLNTFTRSEKQYQNFIHEVVFKYQLFSGLFLNLPFKDINEAGALLSIFAKACADGLNNGKNVIQIIEKFWQDNGIEKDKQDFLLFKFLQFIERQIVLFDALEDAAFSLTHDIYGSGSIDHLINQISLSNPHHLKAFEEALQYYKVRIVLTAHPTQFYPNQILTILADMGKAFKNNNLEEIRNMFLQMGFTHFSNSQKPTPLDEASSLIWYLENIFYVELSKLQNKLPTTHTNLEIGFWPGGDRDGNPFVVADTTLKVASRLRSTILRLYQRDLRLLRRKLTFDDVYEKINDIILKIHTDNYKNASDLIVELQQIIEVLVKSYQSLYVDLVNNLILRVRLFNFHFAKIDIRQNSNIHKQVINHIFQVRNIHDNYADLNEKEKLILLKANLSNPHLLKEPFTDGMANEVINTIKVVHDIQSTNGINAIERYIISNTSSMISIFEVYFLITLVNHHLKQRFKTSFKNPIKLEIVPLFETIDDLKQASAIMESLYTDSDYKKLLKLHNNKQTLMLGFSDGTKDGGYLMANWSIYLAKKQLSALANKYEVDIVFFDGRGGPPARGGGDTRNFYHSMGSNIANNEIQLTIQGQTISSNFGNSDSATFNLEQLFTSGLMAKVFPEKTVSITSSEEKLISLLAHECYNLYLELKNDEMFIPYLEEITPLKYLAEANIGSRPAKRNKGSKLQFEDLRAIPFVGSWSQMKQNILGYYGLGHGIQNLIKKDHAYLAKLKHLYVNSLFFKTLINNSLQSLSKSNFAISRHLKDDPKFGLFWTKLRDENVLSKEMLLKITGHKSLLEMDKVREQSILLPLLVIQQYALASLREMKSKTFNKVVLEKLVKKSLAANINASRNSV